MNSTEQKLWDYIDGNCTSTEQKEIALLIEQDAGFKAKYLELLSFNQEITAMETEEPSMAFTYNVMEAIRTEQAQKPLAAVINPRIIWGIAAFFIIAIVGTLIFVIANMKWQPDSTVNLPIADMKVPDFKNVFTASFVKGFLILDVVLALYLFNAWLRRENAAKLV